MNKNNLQNKEEIIVGGRELSKARDRSQNILLNTNYGMSGISQE